MNIKNYLLILSVLAIFSSNAYSRSTKKPNVILIMSDDISAREYSIYGSNTCTGGDWAKTPVMDKLAQEGCYIKTAWSSTVCMPTRAMLMSGRYAHLTKWWDNGQFGKVPNGGTYEVPESSPLVLGHVAKQAGYNSIWAGKTHVTTRGNYAKFGFDQCVLTPGEDNVKGQNPHEHFRNAKNKRFWNSDSFYWWPEVQIADNPETSEKPISWQKTAINEFGPDIEMEHILKFMEHSKKEKKPFFVYHPSHLGHHGVDMADPKHELTWVGTPKIEWNPKTQTYTRHQPKITPNGPVNTLSTSYTKENITPNALKHHIEYLDYQLWQYINKLEELGELENTIIFFCSDNGTKGGGKAYVIRQRGMHVPMVVYAPGQPNLVKGEQDILTDLSDMLPTLADIMGVQLPAQEEYELSGKSLWPYLTQKEDTHRDWIYGYKGKYQMVRGQLLLRDGYKDWWDVSKTPEDLDHFEKITDLSTLTKAQQKEKEMLDQVLKRFAREDVGGSHSFHSDFSRELTKAESDRITKHDNYIKELMKKDKQ